MCVFPVLSQSQPKLPYMILSWGQYVCVCLCVHAFPVLSQSQPELLYMILPWGQSVCVCVSGAKSITTNTTIRDPPMGPICVYVSCAISVTTKPTTMWICHVACVCVCFMCQPVTARTTRIHHLPLMFMFPKRPYQPNCYIILFRPLKAHYEDNRYSTTIKCCREKSDNIWQ